MSSAEALEVGTQAAGGKVERKLFQQNVGSATHIIVVMNVLNMIRQRSVNKE